MLEPHPSNEVSISVYASSAQATLENRSAIALCGNSERDRPLREPRVRSPFERTQSAIALFGNSECDRPLRKLGVRSPLERTQSAITP